MPRWAHREGPAPGASSRCVGPAAPGALVPELDRSRPRSRVLSSPAARAFSVGTVLRAVHCRRPLLSHADGTVQSTRNQRSQRLQVALDTSMRPGLTEPPCPTSAAAEDLGLLVVGSEGRITRRRHSTSSPRRAPGLGSMRGSVLWECCLLRFGYTKPGDVPLFLEYVLLDSLFNASCK